MTSINLSELNYQSIRSSLLDYLKNQETVKDLNFQGSAVNFLLDLLAYNTLYYAHFANMIASESFLESAQLERSIVSLVKPLGYTVPTKTSSIARIKVRGITTVSKVEPYTLSVEGITPSGIKYQFWNIDEIAVNPVASVGTETDYFSVYEGTPVELSYGGDGFDFPNQEIFIPDLNMDIATVKVSVKRAGEASYTYWNRLDVYSGLFVEPTSDLFSIERTQSGFKIKFANTSSSLPNLVAGDVVNIKYIATNGTNGNNCSTFRAVVIPGDSTVSIVSLASSFGGLNAPNLSEVKRIAPLVFSAQQRLVTKSDYYAFLAQLGYTDGVNVWGGEENSPPIYGRVLFSIAGISTDDNEVVSDLIGKLKERSIVTILPEYIPPISMTVRSFIQVTYDTSTIISQPNAVSEAIKNEINSIFKVGSFNTNYTSSLLNNIISKYQGYQYSPDSTIILSYRVLPSRKNVVLNFKNQLSKQTNGNTVNSTPFTSSLYGGTVQIRDQPIIYSGASINPPSIGKLKIYLLGGENNETSTETDSVVGEVNYKTGVVTLYPGVFSSAITLSAIPTSKDVVAKDQVYLTINAEVQAEALP